VEGSSVSLDAYFRFVVLRENIHLEMKESPEVQFLDLVSELRVKHEEAEIVKKMERAALINLDFWSVLNEDHPDFQKLSEVATTRMEIREEIARSYELICSVASNERVTSLYVSYLEAIENDEDLYSSILSDLQGKFRLEERVLLQDWANTSHPIMVVSVEEATHGTIISANSSCALLLGYEKYEVLNKSVCLLLPGELGRDAKQFLDQNQTEETYFVTHKSGYLLKVLVRSQSYNSMETGLVTIIHLSCELLEDTCLIAVDNCGDRLLGVTSSFVSFLGIDQKLFEEKVSVQDFFQFSFS
jgi:PAS domain-containing protein